MGGAADARITADRSETKHVAAIAGADALARALADRLPRHRYTGDGANTLPGARHFVTTIYFDTASRRLYHEALGSEKNLRLRAKEYYDLHPGLAEVATDARQLVRYHPVLWFEIKHKEGARTRKRRLGIPKRDVPAFFAGGRVTEEMVRIQEDAYGGEAARVLGEVAAICARYGEPFEADALANYRRLAWQDEEGGLRVTLDLDLAFFAPPGDLWTRAFALVRETLGAPRRAEARCVIEVKARGDVPPWLHDALAAAGAARAAFSKFEEASRARHG